MFFTCEKSFMNLDGVRKHAKKAHPDWIGKKKPKEYSMIYQEFPYYDTFNINPVTTPPLPTVKMKKKPNVSEQWLDWVNWEAFD